MGLFGEVDATEVPDNPFYVAPDKYQCVLTEATRVQWEKNGKSGEGLSFKWVIEDEDSDYYQNTIQDWKNINPDVTEEDMTPEIRKDQSRLKSRLLEMNVPESQMDGLLDNLDSLIGLVAFVEVKETADKHDPSKKWTNVTKVTVLEDA